MSESEDLINKVLQEVMKRASAAPAAAGSAPPEAKSPIAASDLTHLTNHWRRDATRKAS